MSTVLLSPASAHHQGRSSTVTCKCPMRGDTSTAPAPNTGTMRKFSTRYCAQKTPWTSPSASGGSTISLGAGSISMATYGEPPRISLALWANALVASTVPTATVASVLMSIVIAFSLGLRASSLATLVHPAPEIGCFWIGRRELARAAGGRPFGERERERHRTGTA